MKRKLTRMVSLLLSLAILLSLANIHTEVARADTERKYSDGEYEVEFHYFQDQSNSLSILDNYAIPGTGKLTIRNGTYHFSNEFTFFTAFHAFKPKMAGHDKAVIVRGSDGYVVESGIEGYKDASVDIIAPPEHAKISFELIDLEDKQDILIHVVIEEINYNNWYNVQLVLDTSALPLVVPEQPGGGEVISRTKEELNTLITEAEALYPTIVEGTGDGFYKEGTRSYLEGSISFAKLIADSPHSTSSQISIAHSQLETTLQQVELNLISVDKSQLTQLLASAQELHSTIKIVGEVLGGPDVTGAIAGNLISEGEYPRSPENSRFHLGNRIAQAALILDNPQSDQQGIDAAYQQLQQYLNKLEADKAVRSTIKLAVLDVDVLNGSTVANSVYEKYIDLEVERYASNRLHARLVLRNITELLEQPVSTTGNGRIRASLPPNTGNLKAANGSLGTQQACPVIFYDEENDVVTCQISLLNGLVSDNATSGIIQFWFDNTLLDKTVILNFNVEQAEALKAQLEDARQLLSDALEESSAGLYPEATITALNEAIVAASEVDENPIATRNELTAAAQQLELAATALQAQKAYDLYFTAAHAAQDTFSELDSYFLKPAKIETEADGQKNVSFKLTGGSIIAEFKVETASGEFEAVREISVDETANTRTVAFRVADLSQLINAKVRVVVPRGAGGTHDATYDIRLNFNGIDNTALRAALSEAASLIQTAVVGNAPGQYPQAAINTLQLALSESGKVATNVNGNQQQTGLSLSTLNSAINYFKDSVIKDNSTPGTPPGSPGPVYPADGYYYIPFTVYQDGGGKVSVANSYFTSPALVRVAGGSKTVSFTVLQSAEITGLTLNGSSGSVASSNAAGNTRVVAFSLSDLSSPINAWVKIDWSALNYHYDYNIQFRFDESSARYAGNSPEVIGGGSPGAPNLPNPDGGGTGAVEGEEEQEEDNAEQEEAAESGENQPRLEFKDTATHWAKASIEKAVKLGIVNGYTDGSFRPNAIVTRGEFAVMISRALGLEGEGDAASLQDFGSIPAWAQAHVARAVAMGLISGFEDATFRTGEQLTRAQLAVIIARAADLELEESAAPGFSDTADIPLWAQKEIAAAVKAGLIQGKGNNPFDPNATATRAEALTLIVRLLESLSKE